MIINDRIFLPECIRQVLRASYTLYAHDHEQSLFYDPVFFYGREKLTVAFATGHDHLRKDGVIFHEPLHFSYQMILKGAKTKSCHCLTFSAYETVFKKNYVGITIIIDFLIF